MQMNNFCLCMNLPDMDNKKINGLYDFTEKFLTKCTLGEMISKYMVLVESEQKLLVMRPYQVYAVKAIRRLYSPK